MKNLNLLVKIFVLSILLSLAVNKIYSQDLIIKKDNEVIKAKILEVGTTEIKYKLFDSPDGPTFTINKREVKSMKIHSENGKSDKAMNVTDDPMSIGNAAIVDKTSSLKFNFFSPLNHHLGFSYEWMIKPGFNWETGLGIVGVGTGLNVIDYHPRGAFIRTGCKFLLGNSSDIEIEGARYAHPLKGKYFKIEAIVYSLATDYTNDGLVGIFINNSNSTNVPINVHSNYTGMALDLIYGRQFIFGNSITVGWYAGIGYFFENKTSDLPTGYTDEDTPNRYAFLAGSKNFPLAWTAGFNVGYIFKTPEWIANIGKSKQNVKAPSRHSMSNE